VSPTTPPQTAGNQAQGLLARVPVKPVKVIAIASGKGGVGKTSVSVNLAMTLAMGGQAVLLLDADLGLANVDVQLGLQPSRNLSHLLAGECRVADLVLQAPRGLKVVPATSGTRRMAQLGITEYSALIHAFSDYREPVDVMVIDTAAGISDSVTVLSQAAQEVVVVVCDEPASITDAYALIKVLSRDFGIERFRVVANMVRNDMHGKRLFENILRVTDRFLKVVLDYAGAIPDDEFLKRAIRRQGAVVDIFPGARSSRAFQLLADTANAWVSEPRGSGHLAFFSERQVAVGKSVAGGEP
jgi:flagellar biosynthesis protein FlhG